MALYKGFAETRVGGAGPWRRFLLDLDLSGLVPAAPRTVNTIDLGGAVPKQLAVRITPRVNNAPTQTLVEIELAHVAGPTIKNAEIRVFLNTDSNSNPANPVPPVIWSPTATDPFPAKTSWVYVAYRGDVGQEMPESLSFHLSQRASPAPGAATGADLVRDDVDIVVTSDPVAGPLHVSGGKLTGDLKRVTGIYDGQTRPDVVTIGLDAPDAIVADFAVRTPSSPTFPLECLWVGIESDHLTDPPAAPAVASNGGGAVDVGTHRYKVSYVLANGNETKASPPSPPITVTTPATRGRVRVTLPIGPTPPTNDPGLLVKSRRVYRTLAGASGDDGEYLLVGERNNNTDTFLDDTVADGALRRPVADRLVVHYSSKLVHDLEGKLTLRTAGVEDVYDATVVGAPTGARVAYTLRPPAGRPRVRWQADAVTDHVEVRLPKLRSGNFKWGEARVDRVPRAFGAHWFIRGATQTLIEIGNSQRGKPLGVKEAVGRAEVVLVSDEHTLAMPRPWRDAHQAVVAEIVQRDLLVSQRGANPSITRLDDARLRVAAQMLRHVRVDLGGTEKAGTYSRRNEGMHVDLVLAPVPMSLSASHPTLSRRVRPLRALLITKTFDDYGNFANYSHVSVRAGDLPDELHLDFRSSPGAKDFGARLTGDVQRLKVLALTEPTKDQESWSADDLRIWVATPTIGEVLDARVLQDPLDATLTTKSLFAEASVRNPRGIPPNATGDPFRHIKAAIDLPGTTHVGPGVVAFGTAGGASSATSLVDAATPFLAAWNDGTVRYLTGARAGERRRITAVATDGTSLTTEAFTGPPTAGAQYAIESVPTVVGLGTADTGSTATTLVDAGTSFRAGWKGGFVRFLTGARAGERQPIVGVRFDGTLLTTNAFTGAPAPGDSFAIEFGTFEGLSLQTPLDGPGASARVAVSKDVERFVATRATPQVALRTAPSPRALTARVYGVRALGTASDPAGPLAVAVLFSPNRVNKAFRAAVRELDPRFAADERDLLKLRIETVPDTIAARADLTGQQFEWRGDTGSGRIVFWAEPGLVRPATTAAAGPRPNTPAGIGLVEGQLDGLPRWARFTVLPSPLLPAAELVPRNFTPPSGWRTSGFKLEVSEMQSVEFLRVVQWGRDNRDDMTQIGWSQIAVTFLRWNQETPPAPPAPPVLTPIWIWIPGEIDPPDETKVGGGLGYRIVAPSGGAGALGVDLTLDADQYSVATDKVFTRWDALSGWNIDQELQMNMYAGEVTLSTSANGIAGGNEGAGPGQWFLKLIGAQSPLIGWKGSAYFGNTAGVSPVIRNRIFA